MLRNAAGLMWERGLASSKFSACSGFRLAPAGPRDMLALYLKDYEMRKKKISS